MAMYNKSTWHAGQPVVVLIAILEVLLKGKLSFATQNSFDEPIEARMTCAQRAGERNSASGKKQDVLYFRISELNRIRGDGSVQSPLYISEFQFFRGSCLCQACKRFLTCSLLV